ncbi:helix-turn-helix domain-containing protein, partial [Burkholderia cenocepacia]
MSEPQPSNGAETNAAKPAPAGLESLAAVGSRLAQLRETKGWSVDDVSARLKVAPQKLRALEAGDISHLPGVTFALGVVRSYAKMLGVDPEPFAQALRRERGVPEVDLSMPASSGTDLPRGRVSIPLGGSSRHHPWLWGTGIVIVAVVAVLMWHTGGDSSSLLARFKGGDAEHASAASAATASSAAEEAGTNAASGAVTNAVPAPAAASAAPAQAIASAVPAPAAPVATAAASQPVAATAAASTAAPAQPASVVVAAGQSMVELKVKQDCWFSVRDKNGKELFSALVRAGET